MAGNDFNVGTQPVTLAMSVQYLSVAPGEGLGSRRQLPEAWWHELRRRVGVEPVREARRAGHRDGGSDGTPAVGRLSVQTPIEWKCVAYEVHGGVATVTLNRPERSNAWTGRMEFEYRRALHMAEHDDGVGAVVITGAGRRLYIGADQRAMERNRDAAGYDSGIREPLDEPGAPGHPAAGTSYGFLLAMTKPVDHGGQRIGCGYRLRHRVLLRRQDRGRRRQVDDVDVSVGSSRRVRCCVDPSETHRDLPSDASPAGQPGDHRHRGRRHRPRARSPHATWFLTEPTLTHSAWSTSVHRRRCVWSNARSGTPLLRR